MSIVYKLVLGCVLTLAAWAAPRPAVAEQITVTHWGVLMYGAPYAIAIEKGYYKEAGLDIDGVLTSKGGGTTMRNVMASSLPYGEVALSAALAAMKQGIDLKIIHTGVRTAGEILWVTMPDSGISSVKDLAGKKVAFTSPKSVTDMLLTMVSDKHGIKSETVAAGGIGAGLTMVEQKAVVAAPVMDPIWSKVSGQVQAGIFRQGRIAADGADGRRHDFRIRQGQQGQIAQAGAGARQGGGLPLRQPGGDGQDRGEAL